VDRHGKPARIAYVESELLRWIGERIQTGREAAPQTAGLSKLPPS